MTELPVISRSLTVATGKDERGRFVSDGNTGRPSGSRNKLSSATLASVKNMKDDAIDALRVAVKDKDSPWHWKALELILSYCLPPGRTVELDDANPETIRQALVDGTLNAEEVKAIAIALEKLKSISEADHFRTLFEQALEILKQQQA